MGFEDGLEKGKSSGKKITSNKLTLNQVIEMGEYKPEYLATFTEWHAVSRHVQFQYIRTAIENRRKHLLTQYAELNNVLDFRLKPHLKKAIDNVLKQLKDIEKDREVLFVEYSK